MKESCLDFACGVEEKGVLGVGGIPVLATTVAVSAVAHIAKLKMSDFRSPLRIPAPFDSEKGDSIFSIKNGDVEQLTGRLSPHKKFVLPATKIESRRNE